LLDVVHANHVSASNDRNGNRRRRPEQAVVFRSSGQLSDEVLSGGSDHQGQTEILEAIQMIDDCQVLFKRFAESYARIDYYLIAVDAT
jgi:hypothetical protein